MAWEGYVKRVATFEFCMYTCENIKNVNEPYLIS